MLTLAYFTVNARVINIIHIRRVVRFEFTLLSLLCQTFFGEGGGGNGRGRIFSNVKKNLNGPILYLNYF